MLQHHEVNQQDVCTEVLKQVFTAGFVALSPTERQPTSQKCTNRLRERLPRHNWQRCHARWRSKACSQRSVRRSIYYRLVLPGPKSRQVFPSNKHYSASSWFQLISRTRERGTNQSDFTGRPTVGAVSSSTNTLGAAYCMWAALGRKGGERER